MRTGGLALVLLLALALPALACSGDDESESSATTMAATVTETEPQGTGEAEEAPTSTGAAVGEQVDPAVIAEAAANTTQAKTARIATLVRVVEPGGQQRFGGQGRFDFERRAGEMTLELIEGEPGAGFGNAKAVFVDSSVYYQLPPGALAGGKSWIRLDLQNVADA